MEEILTDVFNALIGVIFYYINFHQDQPQIRRYLLLYILSALSLIVLSILYNEFSLISNAIYFCLNILIVLILPHVLLNLSVKKIFIFTAMQYLFMILLSSFIGIFGTEEIKFIWLSDFDILSDQQKNINTVMLLVIKCISYIISTILYSRLLNKIERPLLPLVILPIAILWCNYYLFDTYGLAKSNASIYQININLILMSILILYGIFYYMRQIRKYHKIIEDKYERKMIEQYKIALKEEYCQLLEYQERVYKQRHDIKNHILTVDVLLKEEKIKEASLYLHNLKDKLTEIDTSDINPNHFGSKK